MSGRHIGENLVRVEQYVVVTHLKMAMVTVRVAGITYIANDLPLGDGIAQLYGKAGHMGVQRFVAVAVVYLYIVAPAGVHIHDLHHGAAVAGVDRCAVGGRNVHGTVETGRGGVQVGPAGDGPVSRHRPDKGAGAQLADHAVFQPGAPADDLGGGGLQHLHIHHLVVDERPVEVGQLPGDGLAAGNALLHCLALAEIQLAVFLDFGVIGDLPGLGDPLADLDLQVLPVVGLQGGQHIGVGNHRVGQIDTVHQAQIMGKTDPGVLVGGVLPGGFDAVQIPAQVIALGGHEAQTAVQVDGGGFADFTAADAQDLVGHLAFGHGGTPEGERVGRVHIPGQGPVVGGQQLPCRVHTGQHISAGVVEGLLAGHIAHGLPLDGHPQHEGEGKSAPDQNHQPRGRRHGHKIAEEKPPRRVQRVPQIQQGPDGRTQGQQQKIAQHPAQPAPEDAKSADQPDQRVFHQKSDGIQKVAEGILQDAKQRHPKFTSLAGHHCGT